MNGLKIVIGIKLRHESFERPVRKQRPSGPLFQNEEIRPAELLLFGSLTPGRLALDKLFLKRTPSSWIGAPEDVNAGL
jgi:hypothetical protein